MKISVVGTGYVGLVTGACFAEIGHHVTCIDIDAKKVEKMKDGISPIYEPGLEPILKRNLSEKRLNFSTNFESLTTSEVVFIAVGTPSSDDGSADLQYVYKALDSVVEYMNDNLVVVLKSTVPIGTGNNVKKYLQDKTSKKFFVVNNPEFLKEGSAVHDFMKPERIVIGTDSDFAYEKVEELYEPFNRQTMRTMKMSNLSAEMTKYAANCYLATRISFMNEIARLCDRTGANVEEVRQGISKDSRIGSQFLYPGPGYGGSCFPKDVKALAYTAQRNGMELSLVETTEKVNREQKLYMFEKMKTYFQGDLKDKKIALWGVAFKANTDDIRETPAIYMTQALCSAGAEVYFYDPVAADNFASYCEEEKLKAKKCQSKYDLLENADALLILTEWKEFRAPDFIEIEKKLKNPVIFDGRNLYSDHQLKHSQVEYFGIGKYYNARVKK